VTGLPRLLLQEYGRTAMLGAVATFAIAIALIVVDGRYRWRELVDLVATALLVLEENRTSSTPGRLAALNLLICYPVFLASFIGRFPAMLRHLRVVPVGAARLNVMLLAWPSIIGVSAWLALTLLHYAVLGRTPTLLHADMFVALVGFSAFVQSLTLRLTGPTRVLTFGAAVALAPVLYLVAPPHPAMLTACGIAGLAAAARINQRALFSRATYQTVSA
jgi:hypothetical protein